MEAPSVYRVLGVICTNPGIERKAIADCIGVDFRSAAVNHPLRVLKDRKWITAKFEKNKIQKSFYPSDVGIAVIDAVAKLEAFE